MIPEILNNIADVAEGYATEAALVGMSDERMLEVREHLLDLIKQLPVAKKAKAS